MSPYMILLIVLFILVAHRTIEHMICQGLDAKRRKFQLEMGTAAFLFLCWAVSFFAVLLDGDLRMEYLGMTMIATPFILFGIGFFSFLSVVVYKQDTEEDQWKDRS